MTMKVLLRRLEESMLVEGAEYDVQTTHLTGKSSDAEITKAFDALVSDTKFEKGHGGYTGSIAEADGLKIDRSKVYADVQAVYAAIGRIAEKWGPAIAVPVGDPKDKSKQQIVFAGIYSS